MKKPAIVLIGISFLLGVVAQTHAATIQIPMGLTGDPGDEVRVPLNIDDADGVLGFDFQVDFDPVLLEFTEGFAGSVGLPGCEINPVSPGVLQGTCFTTEPLLPGGGSLIELGFAISLGAIVGETTPLDLHDVALNEGQIVVDPLPVFGPDPTDGQITFTPEPSSLLLLSMAAIGLLACAWRRRRR